MYTLITHVTILLIIIGYMYTCRMIIFSACMEESAAAKRVFKLYCSHNQITWLHNPGQKLDQKEKLLIVVCANTFGQNQDN